MPIAETSLETLLAREGIIPLLGGTCDELANMIEDARRFAMGGGPPPASLRAAPFLRRHRLDWIRQLALCGERDGLDYCAGLPLIYAPHQGWCRTAAGFVRLALP